ncbi:MAG: putative small secreted protein [Verrucomicrobiales bacterium]|jgi:predicted small secreted protein
MKTKIVKSIVLGVLGASLITGGLSSCSTTEGFGRDLQKLGSGIEEEAQEHL